MAELFGGQPVVRERSWCCAEYLGKVGHGMARDCEGQLRLLFAGALDANHDERGGVQDGGERSDPGLIVMLRAEEGQNRIGEVALHKFGRPVLPIFEEFAQRLLAVGIAVTAKKFSRSRGRARARVEQGNVHFALRKRTVNEWQIADHGGQEAEPETGFDDNENSRQAGTRDNVAEAQSEKRCAAEIHVGLKAWLATSYDHSRASAVLHEAKSQDQAEGPNPHQNEQRQRAIKAQDRFPSLAGGNETYNKSPGLPGGSIEESRKAKLARHAPRQDDGLKRVPQNGKKDRDTG